MALQLVFRASSSKKSSNSGDPTITLLSSNYGRSSHDNSEGKSKVNYNKKKRAGKRWLGRLRGSAGSGRAWVTMCSASPAWYLVKKVRELQIWPQNLGRGNDGGNNARVEPYFSIPVVVPPPTSIV